MRKLFLDVETTGLDCKVNGIIQIACIDDLTGATFSMDIKPFKGCKYDKGAEKIHGKTKKEIKKFVDEDKAMVLFTEWLSGLQKGRQQFSIAGYNSRFDQDFVTEWFERTKAGFWSYFNYYDIDVFALVKILDIYGSDVDTGRPSKKLTAICNTMKVDLENAHDAMSDIVATKKLYKKLIAKIK